MDPENMKYIVNHLFLPPKLPQEDDRTEDKQSALLGHVVESTAVFCQELNNIEVDKYVRQCWATLLKMFLSMQSLRETVVLPLEDLRDAVERMQISEILCLHISQQNAGIILRKPNNSHITLEFFQASPTAAAVTGNCGKLLMQFPSRPRLSIPISPYSIKSLCAYLVAMDCTLLPHATPSSKKAGAKHRESREVPDIRYISEILGGIATVLTDDLDTVASSTVYVGKRINDHVLWDSALNPWRRDPQWLLIRVALQTSLKGWDIDERYGYKTFITYVLTRALQKAMEFDFDHDLLFVMNAKIATRVSKGPSSEYFGFPSDYIMEQSKYCRKLLEDGWQNLQNIHPQRLSWVIPTREEIRMAEGFLLMRSRNYLSAVYNRSSILEKESGRFLPATFTASLVKDNLREALSPPAHFPTLPIGADHVDADVWLAVLDVEDWITHGLSHWQEETSPELQLSKLAQMITHHDNLTSSLKNPELFSKVFLVALELWVAFDMAACRITPMLQDYSPELSVESFKPLILPTLRQMQRLHEVEVYLISRHSKAYYKKHSAFRFIQHADSFPARYFSNNGSLRSLWSQIQVDAMRLKDKKILEYKRLNAEYGCLIDESKHLTCEYVERRGRWNSLIQEHSSFCQKCAILREAQKMTIDIFEWPLPEDNLLSRLVVFELNLPQPFGLWRDITYHLGRNHSLTRPSTNPRPEVVLKGYTPLLNYYSPNCPSQHISIASTVKSFHASHYRECKFPCREEDVIKNHPLHYNLYDIHQEAWVPTTEFPLVDISEQCTMELPPGPYQKLFWTLGTTDHTANMVIARQSECPVEISYHEWEAYGHLRSGIRLQWLNIVLELVKNTLTFRDPAVHLLFRQAAWQAEKRSNMVYREAHIDLSQESFGKKVVTALVERLACIRDNWQEGWTAATLSIIACRLFSLNNSPIVRRELLIFLESLRETLLQWMDLVLRQKHSQAELTIESAAELRNRVILIAATCRSTFGLDNQEVFTSVFTDHHNVATFIKCAIILHNHVPGKLRNLSSPLRYIVERDIVLSGELAKQIISLTLDNDRGLEDAVRYIWQGFRRDPLLRWRQIGDHSSWITCSTFVQNGNDQTCYVHLDLLDGSFLVNGKTLGTLPKDIRQHKLYQRVFPNQFTVDIMPSTMKGMVYQLSQNINGRDGEIEVHFSKMGKDLLIRIRDIHSHVSEFVETDKLKEDIPNSLLVGTVHIYHHSSKCLQVYPAPSGWDPYAFPSWTMQFTADPLTTAGSHPKVTETLDCLDRTVLCPNSPAAKGLFPIFRSLEPSIGNLVVTWTPSEPPKYASPQYFDGYLQVHLPRYKLTFVVGDQGNLECKELPAMVISLTQSIGTLFGLKNKLILDPKDGITTRKVIIPDGDVKVSRDLHRSLSHPEVTIVPCQDLGLQIKKFIYDVDEFIGRLVGDGTLTSWYFQTYLHILTSSYLPDPLTHRTGVEQALTMLESSNSFAFMELTPEQMKYLKFIVAVTPVRRYYPSHLTSMEQVHWDPVLSPLSQSDCFVPLVQAILDHGHNQALFYGGPAKAIFESYEGSSPLRERAEIRNSRSAFNNFYRKQHLCDRIYLPACCLEAADGDSIERENRVVHMAALVNEWSTDLDKLPDLWKEFITWPVFSTQIDDKITFDCPDAWLLKPLNETWFSLYSCCLSASRNEDLYGAMFALGILSHRSDINLRLVYGALAVATRVASTPRLRPDARLLPIAQFINLTPGHTLQLLEIQTIAEECCIPFEASPQARIVFGSGVSRWDADSFRREYYYEAKLEQCRSLAGYLFSQWPVFVPQVPDTGIESTNYSLINESHFQRKIKDLFSSRFANHCLFSHTAELQRALNYIHTCKEDQIMRPFCPDPPVIDTFKLLPSYVHVTLDDLLLCPNRFAPVSPSPEFDQGMVISGSESTLDYRSIPSSTRTLISRLSASKGTNFLSTYTRDLRRCVRALEARTSRNGTHPRDNHAPQITIEDIQHALQPKNSQDHMLYIAGLWPSLGPESLLGQLSLHSRKRLHPDWQSALVRYAEGITLDQRKRRIAILQAMGLEAERIKEEANHGGQGWEAAEHLDWLLIQIDANLLIRPVQASIAHEMMSPESRQSTVMQLNMGEGKSSVIVPIISASLADGGQLVRVIVLKPLCAQMFHLLKQRICGLANRRLFYLPFSRNVSLDTDKVRIIRDLFEACARDGGVLLCQPEHILSFQLMGLHLLCNTQDVKTAYPFLAVQQWLDLNTRDILDESDEILSVRYQLIYTLGTHGPLEGQPDRWQTIQNVFSLLKDNLKEMALKYGDGLEVQSVEPLSQCFPRTRILTHQCGSSLLELIARQIIFRDKLPSTHFRNYPNELQELVFRFLTNIDISQTESDTLEDSLAEYFGQLLLLRGLFAHGLLLLSLKEKRWRVDYGLDPSRSMLAVPYRAKDCPSLRAEFGHPDMVIVLTCLSYYYDGLSDAQLEKTFQNLLETDSPDLRYEDWIKGYTTSLPESLCHLRGLNLDDNVQKYGQIFPRLRHNKAVIDFYLSECVFPREAKAFQYKLTTNAWDLARTKAKLTTGFSGTNDNSYLLPLSIRQLDSNDQRHTNAQVLDYILQAENRSVVHIESNTTGLGLLDKVVTQYPHIMVLLDIGAQVLELLNVDVAREWLNRDNHPSVEAAIYCDPNNDEFYVLTRDGHVEPFESSLYRTQLNKALVYLDEARTRGTDFKFPVGTRAAVTLGPKLNKDKLVQGCMRMRKLGSDHSLLFFASSEIWTKIQGSIEVKKDVIDSSDVLIWAMLETCAQIKDNGAHWASQGLNFDDRRIAWETYKSKRSSLSKLAEVLREKESRTLKELYGVRENDALLDWSSGNEGQNELRQKIWKKCQEYGVTLSRSSALLEEQERELSHEKEDEREVERVLAAQPLDHSIDPGLLAFVESGTRAFLFRSLADCLEETSRYCELLAISMSFFQSSFLRATSDFSSTIQLSPSHGQGSMNAFLRSVQWILRPNSQPDVLVLISPFEANALLPNIRRSKYVRLHLYSPRVSRKGYSFEGLDFLVVPQARGVTLPAPRRLEELNLFAGQLFYNRFSILSVCHMLGLHLGEIPEVLKARGKVDAGGFVTDSSTRHILDIRGCAFHHSPVAFVRELIGWRRKGQSFTLTHLGKILHGEELDDSEFDEISTF